ncbi:unnamed protein product [Rhizoctonia solani]|uniref:Carboxylic ester hydrolase n=1 Tax=Rhizoctonia solani TaxID=456999 RepID=A0A8H3HDC1_9AGAM|nr:unnamed protein product [Rhizoctonia solani]
MGESILHLVGKLFEGALSAPYAFSKWAPIYMTLTRVPQPLDCPGLFHSTQELIPGLQPYVAAIHPANVTLVPKGNLAYPNPVHDLPEFCRFGAEFNTSKISKFRFEVWLPKSSHWNSRFAFVGNGGAAGGVNYPDMGVPLDKYGFAVASTDTGHSGTDTDGSFAMSNPESQVDFGHRAVHLSAVFSKQIVELYYRRKAKFNYWIGCSSGGKQGKLIGPNSRYFDGVVAGAPAQWWSRLNGFAIHVNMLNSDSSKPGAIIPTSFFQILYREVTSQCDGLDGVHDGIIANPRRCKPDLARVACKSPSRSPFVDSITCLSDEQVDTLAGIYQNWTSISGDLLHPTAEPGSEFGWELSVSGIPVAIARDYFSYQVLNKTSSFNLQVNETRLQQLTAIADGTDPGQINTIHPNLEPFFRRGGKLMHYHGWADPLIPAGTSVWYYEHVRDYFKREDVGKGYRLFMLPGVGHCGGGPGANAFGGAGQKGITRGGQGQSHVFDARHDMILATMAWVEKDVPPESLVGVKYVNDNVTLGTEFNRLFCPYPQEAIYKGGDVNSTKGYSCRLPN